MAMTMFTTTPEDTPFLSEISTNYASQKDPLTFFFLGGKAFYLAMKQHSEEQLVSNSAIFVQIYKDTFHSQKSMEQLYDLCEVTVASMAGMFEVVSHSVYFLL